MAVILNSNLASANAQRRLGQTTDSLARSYERLSSGLRIVRAGDDAAGLAVSASLNVNARIFSQGIRNLNDAISAVTIRESAASELQNVLSRLVELAEQSGNGTLGDSQRGALNGEAQALRSEYNRIVSSTEFNGLRLLNSSNSLVDIQAGGSSVEINIGDLSSSLVNDGSFKAGNSVSLSFASTANIIRDFNKDGNEDMLISSFSNNHYFMNYGNGDGTFKAPISTASGISFIYESGIYDINQDGIDDLILSGGGISVSLGNSDGSFKGPSVYQLGASLPGFSVGDINGDLKLDIVAANYSDRIEVYLGNGDGSFKVRTSFTEGNIPNDVVLFDLNKDGKLDLITNSGDDANVGVRIGVGDGTFNAVTRYFGTDLPIFSSYANDIKISDLNGDGNQDIILATDDGATVLLGNSNGSFRAPSTGYAPNRAMNSVELAHLNGDDFLDIVSGNLSSGGVSLMFGNGDGSFKAPYSALGATSLRSAGVGDLNGDGVKDIVANISGVSPVQIHLGNGTFSTLLAPFSLATSSSALDSLDRLKSSIQSLGISLGKSGADMSRLNSAVSNLSQSRTMYLNAASQITDVDVATEAAEQLRKQILQSTSQLILTQANNLPALALTLLSG